MPLEEHTERRESDADEIDARNFGAVTSSSVVHLAVKPR